MLGIPEDDVTIRAALRRLLSGREPERDPDEFVELVVVPLSKGPLVVSALQAAGIAARGDEAFSVVTDVRSDFRILVPRSQVEDANAILDDAL
jgi:hypothetical protein